MLESTAENHAMGMVEGLQQRPSAVGMIREHACKFWKSEGTKGKGQAHLVLAGRFERVKLPGVQAHSGETPPQHDTASGRKWPSTGSTSGFTTEHEAMRQRGDGDGGGGDRGGDNSGGGGGGGDGGCNLADTVALKAIYRHMWL